MKTLIEHVHEKFVESKPAESSLGAFLDFAERYLAKTRPSSIGHACEMNYILSLQDGESVYVSPEWGKQVGTVAGAKRPGDMQGGSPSVSMAANRPSRGDLGPDDSVPMT